MSTLLAGAGAIIAAAPAANAVVTLNYYVSPSGSDSAAGTSAAPWATVDHARAYIRANGNNLGMTGDVVVHVAPGTYYTPTAINFTDADSGSGGHNVIYQADGAPGSAHLVGGTPVTGWSAAPGMPGVYKTHVASTVHGNTLYENGTRAIQARFPNFAPNPSYPMAGSMYLIPASTGTNTTLNYTAGQFDPSTWPNLSEVSVKIWSLGKAWFTDTTPVAGFDASAHTLTLAHATRYAMNAGSRYFLQGALAFLDQPGEFYLDSTTHDLYYYPRSTADLENSSIVAPTTQKLISFAGASPTARAHHIVLDGLTLEDTDFTDWFRFGWVNAGDAPDQTHCQAPKNVDPGNYSWCSQYDRAINMQGTVDGVAVDNRVGMVFLQNTDHITITNSHLKNAGFSAVFMLFDNNDNTISNSWIEHAGYSGVYLEGPYPGESHATPDPNNNNFVNSTLDHNTFTNSLINDVGELVGQGSGVELHQSSNNTLSRLEIYNSPRYAVANDAYRDNPKADIYAHDNHVQNIRIHDVMQDSGDSAAIYTWGLSRTAPYLTNYFDQIVIDGIHADPSMKDIAPNGVMTDDATNGQTFTNMQVSDTAGAPFRSNGSGYGFPSNVTWPTNPAIPPFDSSLMDYAHIGLGSTFPYSSATDALASFGSPSMSWQVGKGTASVGASRVQGGKPSYVQSEDVDVIHTDYAQAQSGIASMWLYDDTSYTKLEAMARVDNGAWDGGTGWRAIGVDTTKSADHYVYRIEGTKTTTSVPRSTGWHKLTWDYTSGTGVTMAIDGVPVVTQSGVTQFTQISMGDWWSDGVAGAAFWGDALVSQLSDSFESGLGGWTANAGSATTAAAPVPAGVSYVRDTDTDVISRNVTPGQYKVVSLSFYDDVANTSEKAMARADNGVWSDSTNWRGLGVDTGSSGSKYVYRVGATTTASSVARKTGWHTLTWDYRSGTGVTMSIDGIAVAKDVVGPTQFSLVALGDWWTGSSTGTAYWDNFTAAQ
jgi:hypothetical protein